MSTEKFDLTPIWVFLAGIALGFGAFWGVATVMKSGQKQNSVDENSSPACVSIVPDNISGYEFENWISTPKLEQVRDFSLAPDGKLFLILGKRLYLVGLEAPFSAEIELPKEIDGQKLGTITSADWAVSAPLDAPAVYLGTSSGVFLWTIPGDNQQPERQSGKLIPTTAAPERTNAPTDIPFSVKDKDGTLYILKAEVNKILQMGVKP